VSITTVANCKAFRGIESESTEHDEELDRLIVAAQSFLEKECQRTFEQATVTEYFSGIDGQDRLILAIPPIASITNMWDDRSRVYATPISSSLYVIDDAEAGIVRLDGITFSRGLRNIKITYVGGFAEIPGDLEEAAIEMVWAAHMKGEHNLVGVRSRSIADGSTQFLNLAWPLDLEPILSKYRLKTGIA
jgi:hypothetical protein